MPCLGCIISEAAQARPAAIGGRSNELLGHSARSDNQHSRARNSRRSTVRKSLVEEWNVVR